MTSLPKSVLIVLMASLGFNLFLGGVMLGKSDLFSGHKPKANHERNKKPQFNIRGLDANLDPKLRARFHKELQARAADLRAQYNRQRSLATEKRKILTADALNTERLREILAQERAFVGDRRKPLHEALLKILPELDPKDRARFVRALERYEGQGNMNRLRRKPGETSEEFKARRAEMERRVRQLRDAGRTKADKDAVMPEKSAQEDGGDQ